MKTYKKNYIGKGTQVGSMNIVKCVIPVEEAQKTIFEKNGVKYYSFEVAKMQSVDKFNRTHTIYFQTEEVTEEKKQDKAPAKQETSKPKRTRKPKAEKQS